MKGRRHLRPALVLVSLALILSAAINAEAHTLNTLPNTFSHWASAVQNATAADFLLTTAIWILGSALMAMIGLKRFALFRGPQNP